MYTYIPFLLDLSPHQSHPSRSPQNTELSPQVLYSISPLAILYMVVYVCQSYSPNSTHPPLPPSCVPAGGFSQSRICFPFLFPGWILPHLGFGSNDIFFKWKGGRFRSEYEIHTYPCPLNLPTSTPSLPAAGGPEEWRRGTWTGTECGAGTAKRVSEWEIFMSEICSRAPLIMLFIFLSKSSH